MRPFFKKMLSVSSLICLQLLLITIAGAEQQEISLSTGNLPPFFSENLPEGGYVYEITKEAFKRAGYKLEIKWTPWKRAFEGAKKGLYHGVMGAYKSDERIRYFIYSEPVARVDLAFFRRKGEPISFESLKKLGPYRIGVIRGTAPFAILKKVSPPLLLENVSNDEQNIKMLMKGRIDLFLTDLQYVVYVLKNKYPEWVDDIEVIQPPLHRGLMYIVISKKTKNYQQIIDDFNRGLESVRQDGGYGNILKKHGIIEAK